MECDERRPPSRRALGSDSTDRANSSDLERCLGAARRFATRLRCACGARVLQILLFGSIARGNPHLGSDVDILVEIDTPDMELDRRICDLASEISVDDDVTLSPVVYTRERFEKPLFRATPFFANLFREGVPL